MIGKPGSVWWRNLSADFRSNFRVLAAWVYGLQAFVVVPMFLGAIYRREQSLWVWKEYARDVARHGQGDAAFDVGDRSEGTGQSDERSRDGCGYA